MRIAVPGHITGQNNEQNHVKGVDKSVLQRRRRVFENHQAFDEMTEKNESHGVKPGDIDHSEPLFLRKQLHGVLPVKLLSERETASMNVQHIDSTLARHCGLLPPCATLPDRLRNT
jgi:hypothetical protein